MDNIPEHDPQIAGRTYLVAMIPRKPYRVQLPWFAMHVIAASADDARYKAEEANKTVFNTLDRRYAKATVKALELDVTYVF